MSAPLRSSDDELRDLAADHPALVEARSGQFTGVTLQRCLGTGGMSTVFYAELDPARRSSDLSPLSPRRLAIKFTKPSTERQLAKMNVDPLSIYVREVAALGRVMERKPPSEFVLGLYGSGSASVEVAGSPPRLLPWLALEYIDGGKEGATLTERVQRSLDGVDPVRAFRVVSGLIEGARALHGEGIIHRDLKPDNVFLSGPVDSETPKLADCGIARVDGLVGGTIAAMTPAYGGPEQMLSAWRPSERNPLVGPWSDVHALAAVVWFVLAGEEWCRSEVDQGWHAGERRSLRTSQHRLHVGFAAHGALLDRLDLALRRGASHRLPAPAWALPGAADYERIARARFAGSLFSGLERPADVDGFASEILPILAEFKDLWATRAARENKAATAFRPTHVLSLGDADAAAPGVQYVEVAPRGIRGTDAAPAELARASPGGAVFQADGKVLARFGDRLLYFVDDRPHKVAAPAEMLDRVETSRWLVRGPGGGYALVGPGHVVLVRGGRFSSMPALARPEGGEVGEIVAVVGEGRVFGVVTAETDDSNGGPELWRSVDGSRWQGPVVLPINGLPLAVADGPYGLLVAGCSANRKRARALFLGTDDQARVFTAGVNERTSPLSLALCSAGREAWGAGAGLVLRFDGGPPAEEAVETAAEPVALALDLVGVPWMLTAREVLRRHVDGAQASWRRLYAREPSRPALVALGFSADGVHVLDEMGGGVRLTPRDIDAWRAAVDTSLLVGRKS